jgi:hypothetical protein
MPPPPDSYNVLFSAPSKPTSNIPADLDALLTRNQTAAALTEAGFPTSPATLSTKATRGGGPPYQRWGPRVIYRWGTSLEWAKTRLSTPVRSTSELDHAKAR